MNKVAVFNSNFPLRSISLMESTLQLLKSALSIINLLLNHLTLLLKGHALILIISHLVLSFFKLKSNSITFLFRFSFLLVESINLVTHLRDGGIVFLPQHSQSGLMGYVGFIKFHLQLGQFFLTPGIERDLGCSVAASFFKFFIQLVQFSAESTTTLVSPCSGLSLSLQLFIQLL